MLLVAPTMKATLLLPTVTFVFLLGAIKARSDISLKESISKIAFGSCHKSKYATGDIWTSIAASQPQVFLWTGDSVYPPTRGIATVELLKKEYNNMLNNATIQYSQFQPPMGIYGIYDDHDWGGNDVGQGMPEKMERKEAFFDFLGYRTRFNNPLHHSTLFQRPGAYHSIDFGPDGKHQLKVIFLDTRWFREDHCVPSLATSIPLGAGISCIARWLTAGLNLFGTNGICSPNQSILGKAQWTWLEDELKNSQAQVHIIISSIQVLTTNPVMESWGHFPAEKKRLLDALNGVPGTILLSGDVHHAELLDLSFPNTYKNHLYEVTSSGLTHDCTLPLYGGLCEPLLTSFSQHRMAANQYYIGRNFGTVEIDWDKLRVKVNVHNASGSKVLTTGWKTTQRDRLSSAELACVPVVNDGHLRKKATFSLIAVMVATFIVAQILTRKHGDNSVKGGKIILTKIMD